MRLAYTMAPGRGDTDLILEDVSTVLAARGLRLCGTVQINTERETDGPCDMDVKVLPDGPVVRISQALGRESRGCRLNPDALETAVGEVQARLAEGADVLIINKFGKHEAEGRGFRDVIATAIEQDIPVLVGINGLNRDAFLKFSGGIAEEVAPNTDAIRNWIETTLAISEMA